MRATCRAPRDHHRPVGAIRRPGWPESARRGGTVPSNDTYCSDGQEANGSRVSILLKASPTKRRAPRASMPCSDRRPAKVAVSPAGAVATDPGRSAIRPQVEELDLRQLSQEREVPGVQPKRANAPGMRRADESLADRRSGRPRTRALQQARWRRPGNVEARSRPRPGRPRSRSSGRTSRKYSEGFSGAGSHTDVGLPDPDVDHAVIRQDPGLDQDQQLPVVGSRDILGHELRVTAGISTDAA